jgi:DNA-directed RNA polymerase specialized sigma24 family protein
MATTHLKETVAIVSTPQVDPGGLAGRESRFEGMVRQYGRLISTVVARVGGQATSLYREDIEQQVLIELWRQVDREQKIDHPSWAVRAHLAGFDVREVMRMNGWTYQKARNLIARGMAELREALQDRGIHG